MRSKHLTAALTIAAFVLVVAAGLVLAGPIKDPDPVPQKLLGSFPWLEGPASHETAVPLAGGCAPVQGFCSGCVPQSIPTVPVACEGQVGLCWVDREYDVCRCTWFEC